MGLMFLKIHGMDSALPLLDGMKGEKLMKTDMRFRDTLPNEHEVRTSINEKQVFLSTPDVIQASPESTILSGTLLNRCEAN